jgi:hypothetical protein
MPDGKVEQYHGREITANEREYPESPLVGVGR